MHLQGAELDASKAGLDIDCLKLLHVARRGHPALRDRTYFRWTVRVILGGAVVPISAPVSPDELIHALLKGLCVWALDDLSRN